MLKFKYIGKLKNAAQQSDIRLRHYQVKKYEGNKIHIP